MKKLEMRIKPITNFRTSEAYKVIRSNLMFMGSDIKAMVFTSCVENEGKSTVAWNVAYSLAESGKSVIYIDADMRKSVFAGRFRITTNTVGLSEFLSDQVSLNDVIYSTEKEKLYVINSGPFPPNPSELLSRSVFADAINVLKDTFDYVIIDAPPITSTTDPAVIASVCDGSVMVIAAKKISARIIKDGIDQLERTGKPLLGAILNMVDTKYLSTGYRKYYGKYYEASKTDGRKD